MYYFSAVPYLRMNTLLLAFTQRYALGCAVNCSWAPSLSESVALRDRERGPGLDCWNEQNTVAFVFNLAS